MKNTYLLFLLFCTQYTYSQNTFIAAIKNNQTKLAVQGATVNIKSLKLSASANDQGIIIIKNIPPGKYDIEISSVGYKEQEKEFRFPVITRDTVIFYLQEESAVLDEVTVTSTRSGRSVKNTPTRVEVIAEDEVHEEATMRPGDIRMLLSESTGVQTQQTSATTANAGIRIQGLDGRYTQILKDGFPAYSGAANGLGLLQTPPLDLKQVEIIKGSSSTLYGGGAIAGLINLITKTPEEKKELNFNVNITSAKGLDINSFYSQRFKKIGVTIFASRNTNKAFDPANISFSAIPKFERYTFDPKLFLYLSDKTKLIAGVNTTFENRLGGDMKYIEGQPDNLHNYFEENKTKRISTQFTLEHRVNENMSFKFKNSIGYFNRIINSKAYTINATQNSTFSEATLIINAAKNDWVGGINLLTDHFRELHPTSTILRDYNQITAGIFIQNTLNISERVIVESGIRADHVNDYGFAILPRISALFKINTKLTTRLGGGFGYKPPTIFTEESEKLLFKNVLPINKKINELEKSYGANWDINYKTTFDGWNFSINQFFFYTRLKNPLYLKTLQNGTYQFINDSVGTTSKGAETNIKLGYDKFNLYLGYTFTDSKVNNNGKIYTNLLIPKHRLNAALVYEIEDELRIGSELYYFSKQQLSNGNTGKSYWLTGMVIEKFWKKMSIYINFENIGNVRQTKFESIYTGPATNPDFKDIYMPLEGFVVNGGIKIKL